MVPFSYIKDYSGFGTFGIIVIILYLFAISYFQYMEKNYISFRPYLVFVPYIVFIIWLMNTLKISLSFANEGWIVPLIISIICELIDFKHYKEKNRKKL